MNANASCAALLQGFAAGDGGGPPPAPHLAGRRHGLGVEGGRGRWGLATQASKKDIICVVIPAPIPLLVLNPMARAPPRAATDAPDAARVAEVNAVLEQRQQHIRAKEFDAADAILKSLNLEGIQLDDSRRQWSRNGQPPAPGHGQSSVAPSGIPPYYYYGDGPPRLV
jgi:hypothetical protein